MTLIFPVDACIITKLVEKKSVLFPIVMMLY